MANQQTKLRKPISARSKGLLCLVLLLALTVFVSCISIVGLNLDAEGINVLLPWVPVSSANWPKSLPLDLSLGGGSYVEYAYTLADDAEENALENSVATIRNRLHQLGEADAQVSVKDEGVRVEMRKMDSTRLTSLLEFAVAGGQYVFSDSNGNEVLTGKDIEKAAAALSYNNAHTAYSVYLNFTVNKEGEQKLADAGVSYLTVTCDGDAVGSSATVSGNTVSVYMGYNNATYYNNAANYAFLANTGTVDVTLARRDGGTVSGSAELVVKVVLIVAALLLVCSLVYLLSVGKLTGLAAFLGVWCALVLCLFLVADVVVLSSFMLNVGCLAAILLGLVLAAYSAVTRTDAISKQITAGNAPKQATKLGFKMVAKNVWIVHGAALVLALLLMIFDFTRSIGYVLFAGVMASALSTLVMRAFQLCFTAISKNASLFGKVK